MPGLAGQILNYRGVKIVTGLSHLRSPRGRSASESPEVILSIGSMSFAKRSLSPRQETVEDLLAIVRTFSCRLSGMRKKNRKLIRDDFPGSKEPKDIVQ